MSGINQKPKCLALMPFTAIDKKYLEEFKLEYIVDVSPRFNLLTGPSA